LALSGLAGVAAGADACVGGGRGALQLLPVLAALLGGARLPALHVTSSAPGGSPASPGPVMWATSDSSVAQIDALSGAITGRKRGSAVITAQAQGLTGGALVVVSDTLDITLLLDTVYVLPGDTM